MRAEPLERLQPALARGLRPLTWIAGDETLLVIEACDTVRAAARAAGYSERSVHVVERGFRFEDVTADAGAMSLFGSRRLIELRLATKPGQEIGNALGALAGGLDDDVRVLVSSPRLDRRLTESAWFSALERHALVVSVPTIERGALPQWIGARLAAQQQRASRATLELIAERVEGNLMGAQQEVRKLGLLFPPGELGDDAVRAAVLDVARYDVFDVVDAALAADAPRALRSLHGLRAEGIAPPVALWAIAEAARNLCRLAAAREAGRPLGAALRDARIWGERERLYAAALARVPARHWRALLREAAAADRIIKGLAPGDEWQALESITMRIAGLPMLAALEPPR